MLYGASQCVNLLRFNRRPRYFRLFASTPPLPLPRPISRISMIDIASNMLQQAEPTQTRPISDDLVIKNDLEYEETKLALCLVDHEDTRLPIVNWSRLPYATSQCDTSCRKDQTFTINGQLYVQAYASSSRTDGCVCTFFSTRIAQISSRCSQWKSQ